MRVVAVMLALVGALALVSVLIVPDIIICKCRWVLTKAGWEYVCCQ